MKKFILLLLLFISLGCSKEEDITIQASCQCIESVQYSFIQNGTTTTGDHYTNPIPNTDCGLNGTFTVVDTPFNGGIIRKETTITCQ